MIEAGIDVRHITDKSNVPMYKTNRLCRPAGRLQGELVVSECDQYPHTELLMQ